MRLPVVKAHAYGNDFLFAALGDTTSLFEPDGAAHASSIGDLARAVCHRHHGIGVSILCPQAVDTPMLGGAAGSQNVDGVLSPAAVAQAVVEGLAEEHFLILPHPQVVTYMQRKTGDYDRWIRGMARLREQVMEGARGAR